MVRYDSYIHRKLFEIVYTKWSIVADYRRCLLSTLSISTYFEFLHGLIMPIKECKLDEGRDLLFSCLPQYTVIATG